MDLLKKDWKRKADSFLQKSEHEIYTMSQKRSTSIVKWIFIVSVIELSLGIVSGLILSFTKYDKENVEMIKEMGIYPYYIGVTVLLYAVILYFIVRFYQMFRKIAIEDNTQKLLSTILRTRKVVKQYIAFNLTAFAVLFIAVGSYSFYSGYTDGIATNGEVITIPLQVAVIGFLILIVVTGVLTFVFWCIYKLIYGWLLKRLHKNYEELKKIDL